MKIVFLLVLFSLSNSMKFFLFGNETMQDYAVLERSHTETLPETFTICLSFKVEVIIILDYGRYLFKIKKNTSEDWFSINYECNDATGEELELSFWINWPS